MSGDVIDLDARRKAKAVERAAAAERFRAAVESSGLGFERGDHAEIADVLLRRLSPDRALVKYADGTIFVYDPSSGLWRERTREALRAFVKSFAGAPKMGTDKGLNVTLSAADGAIAFASADVADPEYFTTPTPGIAFVNGFVRLDGGKIVVSDHAPDHRARAGFPFAYAPNAPHPLLDGFLESIFADASEDDRAARMAMLAEFIGACLTGIAPTYQKALALFGPGGNGKSEVQRLARAAMPEGTVVSLPPQQWGERFQLANLVGKLANLCDEIPEREIVGGDTFKSVVSGEPVHAERKNRDPFNFTPRAGHIFAANALPGTADHSEGFWRRLLVLTFGRRFDNAAERRPEAAKAIVEQERAALVAWAIEGAARLQRQGGYTIPESATAALETWRTASDSVASFCDEKTKPVDRTVNVYAPGTKASALYAAYRTWTDANGLRPVSSREFSRRMADRGKHVVKLASGNFYPVELGQEATS